MHASFQPRKFNDMHSFVRINIAVLIERSHCNGIYFSHYDRTQYITTVVLTVIPLGTKADML